MELDKQKKLNAHIFRLLKVNEIVIPIGRTNKGNLGLKFQANSEDFEIYLDAVPLSTKSMLEDDNNIELKKMLEKYLFDSIKLYPVLPMGISKSEAEELNKIVDDGTTTVTVSKVMRGDEDVTDKFVVNPHKKRGRPAGAKNRIKA